MEYNTAREPLPLVEYGRHVKRIVDNCVKIEDRDKRNKMALEIIELMGQLNPHLRNVEDFRHKLWDHLFMLSEFKLDVDSPYPKTTKSQIIEKPEPLPYPDNTIRHRNYGKLVEKLVDKARADKDPERRAAFAQCIGNYMKLTYASWNKDNTSDETIKNDLRILSMGELSLTEEDNINALTKNMGSAQHQHQHLYKHKQGGQKKQQQGNRKYRNKNKHKNRPQPPQ